MEEKSSKQFDYEKKDTIYKSFMKMIFTMLWKTIGRNIRKYIRRMFVW